MGVGGQRHSLAIVPLYPLYKRLGGPQDLFGRVRKISPQPGFNPRNVQPVASRYTVYALPAHLPSSTFLNTIVSLNRTEGLDLHANSTP
jgi:hypothetical protein